MNVPSIAKQFGVKVSKQKKIQKGIYRIVTTDGNTFSLKRMPKQVARFRWIDQSLLRVRRKGSHLAWRNPQTPEGHKPHAISPKGELFVLTPWISGRKPSPHSLKDMQACGIALARFHKAGRANLMGTFDNSEIGTWYSTFSSWERSIKNKISKAKKNRYSLPISQFIKKNGPEIIGYSISAKTLLQNSGYYTFRRNPRHMKVLCHGDGGPSNFILNDKGTYLIDFETLHVNLRAYDLYRVIYNSCKDYEWDFSIAAAILDGYRQVSQLNMDDYKLIRVWLRFPFSTYLVLSSFKRFPLTQSRLQWALKSERRIGPFLKKLDKYAVRNSSKNAGH
ncbi:phosphotransferase [Paenibacillus sp. KQZ6P-2]|uniref:Phosphotransferase n=1 Tax=Paenibacillus mangrovi TaxID=2931978 RepID=A0A9X2B2W4_9BACL|nr:phosphotransferase [Paenibacillus mangrovi]MCJ8012345.1 phosphotransferase [Paenibacillus mangrovi]